MVIFLSLFSSKNILFIYFLERGEGEREGEKHQCVVASHEPLTGDIVHNPGMCPDWESNLQLFGSQARTESTELHKPGLPLLKVTFNFFNISYNTDLLVINSFSFFLVWEALCMPIDSK